MSSTLIFTHSLVNDHLKMLLHLPGCGFVCCSLLSCNYICSDNNQIRKAACKYKQILEKTAEGQLMGVRATKLPIFSKASEATTARRGSTCKQNGTRRSGAWHRINGRCWRPLDPYDKVMEERRMAGVQPGRARGPPCLTNTLCAR